jgi:hypothetical protein
VYFILFKWNIELLQIFIFELVQYTFYQNRAVCNKTITTLELDQYEVLWSRVQQYWTRLRLVQYCCTLLHRTSYWSRSSAVIERDQYESLIFILHKFFNIIIWTLRFRNFMKTEIFEFHFLTYWLAKSNFCAIKTHIALSCKINEWNFSFHKISKF